MAISGKDSRGRKTEIVDGTAVVMAAPLWSLPRNTEIFHDTGRAYEFGNPNHGPQRFSSMSDSLLSLVGSKKSRAFLAAEPASNFLL